MNMKKYSQAPAQGFTLVELIVVIVILAILATIAFLSFGSQSAAARDSKRKTDLSNIASKMNIAMANGTTVLNLVGTTGSEVTGASIAGTAAVVGTDYKAGEINFNVLGVNGADFKDPLENKYLIGATSKAGGPFQIAATLENDNAGNGGKNAFVVGNYSARTTTDTNANVSYVSGATTITLDPSQVGMFKKGDAITVNAVAKTVGNVSSDLAKITLDTPMTDSGSSVALELAADEVKGLVVSTASGAQGVVNGDTTYYPY